jgi:hypothetical protein
MGKTLFAISLLVLGIGAALADPPSASGCQFVVDPLNRLKCYDDVNAAIASQSQLSLHGVLIEILQSPAALAAIFAAVIALISGILGPAVQLAIGARQARASQTSADAAMAND